MRRRSLATGLSSHEVGRVNVTPLIDVVMCMIIFYLIVGHLVMQRQAEERLPQTAYGIEDDSLTDPLVISVLDANSVLIDGGKYDMARVESVVAGRLARQSNLRVRIRADRTLAFGDIRPTIEACRAAGVGSVELAAERAP